MDWKISLFKIYSDEEDIEAVNKIIRRGTYWALGPEIEEFEEKIATYMDRRFALTFNSGTAALHALFLAYEIKSSEVIVPSFTFIATANTVLLAGGKPIFAEIEEDSFGLNPNDVNEKITKKTKAIVPVHYGGQVCKYMKELRELADDHNLLILEDAAESLGSKLKDTKAGNFGQSSMFSLCQNKIITTGEGGFVVTDDNAINEKLKLLRSHGRVEFLEGDYFSNTKDNEYIQIGFNMRIPTMSAALGISQLNKIDKIAEMRRKNAFYMNEGLGKIASIKVPEEMKEAYHIYQLYTLKFDNTELRDKVQIHLTNNGIMSKIYFNPIHLKTFYMKEFGYKKGNLPITEDLSQRILTLPMYPQLTNEEMDYMIKTILEALK